MTNILEPQRWLMIILDILLVREMVRSPTKLGGPFSGYISHIGSRNILLDYEYLWYWDDYIGYIVVPTLVDVKCPLSGWVCTVASQRWELDVVWRRYKDPHTWVPLVLDPVLVLVDIWLLLHRHLTKIRDRRGMGRYKDTHNWVPLVFDPVLVPS